MSGNRLSWSQGLLQIVADTTVTDQQFAPQEVWTLPAIPPAAYLTVALEPVAQTGRTGIRVTSLALPGTAATRWALQFVGYQGAAPADPQWTTVNLTGNRVDLLLDQPMPTATYRFRLASTEPGRTPVLYPEVSITTPADSTVTTVTGISLALSDAADDYKLTDAEKVNVRRWLEQARLTWMSLWDAAVARLGSPSSDMISLRDGVWKPSYAYFAAVVYDIAGIGDATLGVIRPGTPTYDGYGSLTWDGSSSIASGIPRVGTLTFVPSGAAYNSRNVWFTYLNGLGNSPIKIQGMTPPTASALGAVKAGTNIVIAPDGTISASAALGTTATWGSITGSLAAQADLQAALGTKINKSGDTGIGSLSMAALVVVGSLGTATLDSTGSALSFSRASANYIKATDAAGSLHFQTGGANNRLIIAASGNFDFQGGAFSNMGVVSMPKTSKVANAGNGAQLMEALYSGIGEQYSSCALVLGTNIKVDPADTVNSQLRIKNTHATIGYGFWRIAGNSTSFYGAAGAVTAGDIITPTELFRVTNTGITAYTAFTASAGLSATTATLSGNLSGTTGQFSGGIGIGPGQAANASAGIWMSHGLTGTGTSQYGIVCTMIPSTSATTFTAGYFQAAVPDGGALTSSRAIQILDVVKSGSGTVQTNYGLLINAMTGGVTNYAIYANGGLTYFGDTTDSTGTTSNAAIRTSGGLSVAKAIYSASLNTGAITATSGVFTAAIYQDVGTGNANASLVLVGRNAGAANYSYLTANWNGGMVLIPALADPTVAMQHPNTSPAVARSIGMDFQHYSGEGRVIFGKIVNYTENVTDGTSSAGYFVHYVRRAGQVVEAFRVASTGEVVVTTAFGYGKFGPSNTSWFHMSTDRANFYMNKGLHTVGGFTVYGTSYGLSSTGGLTANSGNFTGPILFNSATQGLDRSSNDLRWRYDGVNYGVVLHTGNVGANSATLRAASASATAPMVGTYAEMVAFVPSTGATPYWYSTDVLAPDGQPGRLYKWNGSAWADQGNPQTVVGRVVAGVISAGAVGAQALAASIVLSSYIGSPDYAQTGAGVPTLGWKLDNAEPTYKLKVGAGWFGSGIRIGGTSLTLGETTARLLTGIDATGAAATDVLWWRGNNDQGINGGAPVLIDPIWARDAVYSVGDRRMGGILSTLPTYSGSPYVYECTTAGAGLTTGQATAAAWSSGTTYTPGQSVTYATRSYTSKTTANTNHVPTVGGDAYWTDNGSIYGPQGTTRTTDSIPDGAARWKCVGWMWTTGLANAGCKPWSRSLVVAVGTLVCSDVGSTSPGYIATAEKLYGQPVGDQFNPGGTFQSVGGTRIYRCVTAGTTSASGNGPSGTSTSISDGTAVWEYWAENTGSEDRLQVWGINACSSSTPPVIYEVRIQPKTNRDNLDALTHLEIEYTGADNLWKGRSTVHNQLSVTVPSRKYFSPSTPAHRGNMVRTTFILDSVNQNETQFYQGAAPYAPSAKFRLRLHNVSGVSAAIDYAPWAAQNIVPTPYANNLPSAPVGGIGGGGGGGGACPEGWVPVTTARGIIPAQEVVVGDVVPTRHETTGEPGEFRVIAVSEDMNETALLTFRRMDGEVGALAFAINHRFLATTGEWTPLSEVLRGMVLVGTSGEPIEVLDIQPRGINPVVKITVADAHTYDTSGLLSHNVKILD